MLNSEHLIPLAYITTLMRQPPAAVDEQVCKNMYVQLSERYRFSRFELRGGVALMSNEAGSSVLEISPQKLTWKDESVTGTYAMHLDDMVALTTTIQQQLRIPFWVPQHFVLRMMIPHGVAGQPVNRVLCERLLRIESEDLRIFERPLAGACLKMVFPVHNELRYQYEVKIEPWFRDQNLFFLEVAGQFLEPVTKPEEVRERGRLTHQFLCERTVGFLRRAIEPPDKPQE